MLDHLFISVSDIRRSVRFYQGALAPLGITTRFDYDGKDGPPGHPDLKGFGANGRMFFWLREGLVDGRAVHVGPEEGGGQLPDVSEKGLHDVSPAPEEEDLEAAEEEGEGARVFLADDVAEAGEGGVEEGDEVDLLGVVHGVGCGI